MIHLFTQLFQEFQKDETSVILGKTLVVGFVTGITGTMEHIDLALAIALKIVSIISFLAAIVVAAPKVGEVLSKWNPFKKKK